MSEQRSERRELSNQLGERGEGAVLQTGIAWMSACLCPWLSVRLLVSHSSSETTHSPQRNTNEPTVFSSSNTSTSTCSKAFVNFERCFWSERAFRTSELDVFVEWVVVVVVGVAVFVFVVVVVAVVGVSRVELFVVVVDVVCPVEFVVVLAAVAFGLDPLVAVCSAVVVPDVVAFVVAELGCVWRRACGQVTAGRENGAPIAAET